MSRLPRVDETRRFTRRRAHHKRATAKVGFAVTAAVTAADGEKETPREVAPFVLSLADPPVLAIPTGVTP